MTVSTERAFVMFNLGRKNFNCKQGGPVSQIRSFCRTNDLNIQMHEMKEIRPNAEAPSYGNTNTETQHKTISAKSTEFSALNHLNAHLNTISEKNSTSDVLSVYNVSNLSEMSRLSPTTPVNNLYSKASKVHRVDVIVCVIIAILSLLNLHYLVFLNLSTITLDDEQNSAHTGDYNASHMDQNISDIFDNKQKIDTWIKIFNDRKHSQRICYPLKETSYEKFLHKIWSWIDISVFSIIPFVIMLVNNVIIIGKIKKRNENYLEFLTNKSYKFNKKNYLKKIQKNNQIIYMLLAIKFYFLACMMPFWGWFYYNREYKSPLYAQLFVYILLYTNNAFNFFFYGISSQKYRQELFSLFRKKKQQTRE